MSIIGILLAVLVICVLYWGANSIIKAFSVQDPAATLIRVAVVVLSLIIMLGWFGYGDILTRAR